MTSLVKAVSNAYHYVNTELADPRTNDYPLVGSPWSLLTILVLYYNFVHRWGPKMMKNREPFQLRKIMIVYNVLQIIMSLFFFVEGFRLLWLDYYSLKCQPVSYEDTPKERAIVFRVWLYYMVKIFDLLDTIFFVLRKKQNQASHLHTYHHMSITVILYIGTKYYAGGHGAMVGTINSLVHAVMYTYYLLTSLNNDYSKNIWWKKYITQLQIVQFLLLDIHFTQILFRPSCTYPKWIALMNIPQTNYILYMFVIFYIKNYTKKKEN